MFKKIRSFVSRLRGSVCKHGVPSDWAFDHYGAVYQGGVCPTCGKLNQGRFLGNLTGHMEFYDEKKKKFVPVGGKTVNDFTKEGWKLRALSIR